MSKNNNQQYKNYSEDYNGKIGIDTTGQKFQLIKNNSNPVYNYEVRDMDGNYITNIREQCIPKFFNKIYKPSESKIILYGKILIKLHKNSAAMVFVALLCSST